MIVPFMFHIGCATEFGGAPRTPFHSQSRQDRNHEGFDVMEVADFVAKALAGRDDIEQISDGYRIAHPHDGVTSLTFRAVSGADNAPLTAVATVETRFAMPDWGEEGVAWINRRAALGAYFREDGGMVCRLAYSLYRHDPDARAIAAHLLEAFRGQLILGFGLYRMDHSDSGYHRQRRLLIYPRRWSLPLPATSFEDLTHALRRYGSVTACGPDGITLEVPMTSDTTTRAADPEAETALISVRTDVQHPLVGVGYTATMSLPRQPAPEQLSLWCAQLNALEHRQTDFAPRLGAWGRRDLGTRLVYGMFWPIDRAGATAVTNVAHWMIRRALWIRKDLWIPGAGLCVRDKG